MNCRVEAMLKWKRGETGIGEGAGRKRAARRRLAAAKGGEMYGQFIEMIRGRSSGIDAGSSCIRSASGALGCSADRASNAVASATVPCFFLSMSTVCWNVFSNVYVSGPDIASTQAITKPKIQMCV